MIELKRSLEKYQVWVVIAAHAFFIQAGRGEHSLDFIPGGWIAPNKKYTGVNPDNSTSVNFIVDSLIVRTGRELPL